MDFNKWLMEMTKQIQSNPQSKFESSNEAFAKDLEKGFKEHGAAILKDRKKAIRAMDKKLKAMDSAAIVVELNPVEIEERKKIAFDRKKAQDSYDNSALLLGKSDTFSEYDTYSVQGLLYNWYLWTSMYMSSWVFARAIDKPASDMIRNGWKIKLEFKDTTIIESKREGDTVKAKKVDKTSEVYGTFYKKQKRFIQDLIQANKLARLYGGAVAGLIISGETEAEYEKELTSIDEKAVMRLIVADRWQNVIPSPNMVKDIASDDWNMPDAYTIRTDSGDVYKLHHSRVLRFTNGTAPTLIQRMLVGWGIPLGVRIYNEVNRDERMKNMISSLLAKQSLEIVQTAGMRAYANGTLTPEQEARLDQKLELINRYRHFNSILFLDKDDVYTRQEGSAVGTLANLMDSNSRFVAGAIPMPQVLLYGDQQKGLSGNAVDDMRLYEDDLMTQRHEKMLNQIMKLSGWILLQMKIEYVEMDVIFNSSISPTTQEIIDRSKAMIETYRQLKDLEIYDVPMIAQELKDSQDELIFGSALTEEKMEEIIERFKPKEKKGKGGGDAGGGSEGAETTELDFPELGPDDMMGGEGDQIEPDGPSVTDDELDISEGDFVEETVLDNENVPEPDVEPGVE